SSDVCSSDLHFFSPLPWPHYVAQACWLGMLSRIGPGPGSNAFTTFEYAFFSHGFRHHRALAEPARGGLVSRKERFDPQLVHRERLRCLLFEPLTRLDTQVQKAHFHGYALSIGCRECQVSSF